MIIAYMTTTYNDSLRPRVFGTVQRFIEPCILLFLSKDTSHGYGLLEDLEKHCGEKVDIGNLYRTLRKMETNGWVKSEWDGNKAGHDRRMYTITKKGHAFLENAVVALTQTDSLIHRFFEGYQRTFQKGVSL